MTQYIIGKRIFENIIRQEKLRLISHRLKGFGGRVASTQALLRALSLGVRWIEIDTRHTLDSKIIISHDPNISESNLLIHQLSLRQIYDLFPQNQMLMTLDECLKVLKGNNRFNSKLCIDIKDAGLEEQYVEMIRSNNVLNQVVIASWIPQVLIRIHKLEPSIPLVFSHISCKGSRWLFFLLKVLFKYLKAWKILGFYGKFTKQSQLKKSCYYDVYFGSENNEEPYTKFYGKNCEFFLLDFVGGELEKILIASKGAVCLPHFLVDETIMHHYHALGISVWVFNINDEDKIKNYICRVNPDLILCDNADLIVPKDIQILYDSNQNEFPKL